MTRVICLTCGKEMKEKEFPKHRKKTGHISRIEKSYYRHLERKYKKDMRRKLVKV